jgi:hypothetical protein
MIYPNDDIYLPSTSGIEVHELRAPIAVALLLVMLVSIATRSMVERE